MRRYCANARASLPVSIDLPATATVGMSSDDTDRPASVAACLISAGNAASRYLFSASSNAWLEVQWYMFAGMVLLGGPYTLKVNEHVRVDLFYSAVSERVRIWIDILGCLTFTTLFASMGFLFSRSAALIIGHVKKVEVLLLVFARVAAFEQVRHTNHRIERGAYLMRHGR